MYDLFSGICRRLSHKGRVYKLFILAEFFMKGLFSVHLWTLNNFSAGMGGYVSLGEKLSIFIRLIFPRKCTLRNYCFVILQYFACWPYNPSMDLLWCHNLIWCGDIISYGVVTSYSMVW